MITCGGSHFIILQNTLPMVSKIFTITSRTNLCIKIHVILSRLYYYMELPRATQNQLEPARTCQNQPEPARATLLCLEPARARYTFVATCMCKTNKCTSCKCARAEIPCISMCGCSRKCVVYLWDKTGSMFYFYGDMLGRQLWRYYDYTFLISNFIKTLKFAYVNFIWQIEYFKELAISEGK